MTSADGTVIVNTGFVGSSDLSTAQQALSHDRGELFSIGRAFISNPDLIERLKADAPLADPDMDTFYAGGAKGYVDYPTLEESAA